MKGHLEGMMYNIGPYKDRDTYLQKNFQTVQDMEQLVREILGISKLEQHTFKLKLEEVNLAELINIITKNLGFCFSKRHSNNKTDWFSPFCFYRSCSFRKSL